jgi:8-oxo-dGTP diphosphatase
VLDYDPRAYPPVAVTVDVVLLTIRDDRLMVLAVRRGVPPYLGQLALPGGFVRSGEGLEAAAVRELAEETGLAAGGERGAHLEQLASYGDPDRDPRMRIVSIAYLALAPRLPLPEAGSDAAEASWIPADDLLAPPDQTATDQTPTDQTPTGQSQILAFDHRRILADGVERARSKLEYTSLATAFCPPEFTVAELRRVYEVVWGTVLDPRNFHRKVTGTPGFLAPAGSATSGERGRPAQVYRKGPALQLHPPILRH